MSVAISRTFISSMLVFQKARSLRSRTFASGLIRLRINFRPRINNDKRFLSAPRPVCVCAAVLIDSRKQRLILPVPVVVQPHHRLTAPAHARLRDWVPAPNLNISSVMARINPSGMILTST